MVDLLSTRFPSVLNPRLRLSSKFEAKRGPIPSRVFQLAAPLLGLCAFLASCATRPPANPAVDQMVADYYALRPSQALTKPMTMAEALQFQKAFVKKLMLTSGPKVGYKVGLVTRESQQRFGVNAPVRGVLLSKMLLPNGAEVPAKFGVQPLCEADMIVVVKDRGINKATSLLEAAQHLKELVAFIELPDSFLATNQPLTGVTLTAANIGARLGVLGGRLPIQATPGFIDALAEMKVTMTDQTGTVLADAQGKLILDHPLHALLWLIEELHRSGERLKAGDLISLGGLKVITPQPGQTISVHYDGLSGGPIKAMVTFR
jgi:2-keto-4-pentenoate hydratase